MYFNPKFTSPMNHRAQMNLHSPGSHLSPLSHHLSPNHAHSSVFQFSPYQQNLTHTPPGNNFVSSPNRLLSPATYSPANHQSPRANLRSPANPLSPGSFRSPNSFVFKRSPKQYRRGNLGVNPIRQQMGGGPTLPNNEDCGIRDVWAHNLELEFKTIRQVVQKYQYIAMDTEFPGVVARPIGEFRTSGDYQYQTLKCNVNLLRIIQLGLTFLDENGNTPKGSYTTWQFNFKFNLQEDMYAQDSIDMLQNSGIQFKKHEEEGIDPLDFAELLMSSGIVLTDDVKWLSFHSGYDFGYLLKLLTDQNLPQEESEFFEILRIFFPTIYDVKYLMKSCKNLKGGLQEVAEQLELQRVGPQHQAGSDSLLTGMVFFKMREMFFEDNIDDAKYCGHLYGLGTSFVVNGSGGYLDSNGDNSSSS